MNTVFDAEFIPFYKMVDFTAKESLKFTQQFKQEPTKNPLSKDQIGASGWDASPSQSYLQQYVAGAHLNTGSKQTQY